MASISRQHGRLYASIDPDTYIISVGFPNENIIVNSHIEAEFFQQPEDMSQDSSFAVQHQANGVTLVEEDQQITLTHDEFQWLQRFVMNFRRGVYVY